MKYLFVLGRNTELSIEEIKGYLEKIGNNVLNNYSKENGLILELENPLERNVIDCLGGTISIGEIIADKISDLDSKEIYGGVKNNLAYTILNICGNQEELKEYLRLRFKQEKIRASFKPIHNSPKVTEEYFCFENYIGRIIQKCDYKSIEERDMKKPVRRESLAISPRLAKIMINLSQVKENQTLLDPFCGIGVILQETLLQNIKVIGIDKDKDAINGARKNLEWFKFSKKEYQLFNIDSRKCELAKADVIVTEPHLGEILKKSPSKSKAKKILESFEDLIINVLNNLKKKVNKRIVFTSPLILTEKKRIGCDIGKITSKTKLKQILNEIDDFREGQVVGRRIFVLE